MNHFFLFNKCTKNCFKILCTSGKICLIDKWNNQSELNEINSFSRSGREWKYEA